MKKDWLTRLGLMAIAGVCCAGCIQITNTAPAPAVQTAVSEPAEEPSDIEETIDEAPAEEPEETVFEEELEPRIEYRLDVMETGYTSIGALVGNEWFAVSVDGKWGVIDANGEEIYPAEYDHYATDGKRYFSLSKEMATGYDATLYDYDAVSKTADEIWDNVSYPSFDITSIYAPYMTLSERDINADVRILCIEWRELGPLNYDFYRLVQLTPNNVTQAGFDIGAWNGASDFFSELPGNGGVFISCEQYLGDRNVAYNIVGVNSSNQIVYSDDEAGRTVQILPYAPTTSGYYAGYVIDTSDNSKRLAYGNVENTKYATSEMTAFPEEATVAFRDIENFHAAAGKGDRIVLGDASDKCAIFNMKEDTLETAFDFASIQLPLEETLPARVTNAESRQGHLPADEDAEPRWYDAASQYDPFYDIALVVRDGRLYAVDEDGRRVSEFSEEFGGATVAYLQSDNGHAFRIAKDGKEYLCAVSRN